MLKNIYFYFYHNISEQRLMNEKKTGEGNKGWKIALWDIADVLYDRKW